MTADGADCGQLLPVAPPLIHTQLWENGTLVRLLYNICNILKTTQRKYKVWLANAVVQNPMQQLHTCTQPPKNFTKHEGDAPLAHSK